MKVPSKALRDQVILITGASSGIGRCSAVRAGAAGAKVILIARNKEALESAAAEIERAGGQAFVAVADVADAEQFKRAADGGAAHFGRIDTWVNNAGVGMYSRLLRTDIADDRRLFETNFWGIVIGSRLAVPHLMNAGGGRLINLGSEVSDIALTIQGMYATSKHAIMGFTDGLRREIIEDGLPISVTLIKPSAINTPFPRHAKNNLDRDATLPSPVYAVDLAADQILHAAVHGGRELYVGGGGRLSVFLNNHFPYAADVLMAKVLGKQQLAPRPADHSYESLHQTRGGFHSSEGDVERDRHVQQVSLYGVARRHPVTAAALVAAAAVGVAAAVGAKIYDSD